MQSCLGKSFKSSWFGCRSKIRCWKCRCFAPEYYIHVALNPYFNLDSNRNKDFYLLVDNFEATDLISRFGKEIKYFKYFQKLNLKHLQNCEFQLTSC